VSVRDVVELTCKEVVEIIDDYLAGALPMDDQVRFEQHLHACTWCMTYLDQLRQTQSLSRSLSEQALPEETKSKLLDAFRLWKRQ
jgi:anti-sigma factor RsiW